MRRLFGTDGIRGVAGDFPLDRTTVETIGLALAHSLKKVTANPRVLLGMDTRESGPWMAAEITRGLRRGGAEVISAGVIPTPGVASLTLLQHFDAGVVISASHNPWRDNGIKVFGADGYKLPDLVELRIEEEIFDQLAKAGAHVGTDELPPTDKDLAAGYEEWLLGNVAGLDLNGTTIVLDCANGAASYSAPGIFQRLGAKVRVTHAEPNGRNINEDCGALHPEVVAAQTAERSADIGITFDGDADRALFASSTGKIINGDAVLLLVARDLKRLGQLPEDLVVATTMSNMGLEAALLRSGIHMLRAPVGDKYVLEEMRRVGAVLGGEQSGHIIFSQRATTGDGLLTALVLLDLISRSGQSLDELVADLKVFPQVIENVRVREKKPFDSIPAVSKTIAAAELALDGNGRVVVRYSGTEKLARVMIEAESESLMRHHAHAIADAIRDELGA